MKFKTAPADYVGIAGSLTFLSGEVSKSIPVPTASDSLNEGAEQFSILLHNASSDLLIGPQNMAICTITGNIKRCICIL